MLFFKPSLTNIYSEYQDFGVRFTKLNLVHINVHMNVHINVHMIIHIKVYINCHTNVHIKVYMNVYINVHMNIHENVYLNVHMNMHMIYHIIVHMIVHINVMDIYMMLFQFKCLYRYSSKCSHEYSKENCQNPNLTSTQRLGFTRKWLYNHHHHHPPHKLNVSNISAVTDPILMKL